MTRQSREKREMWDAVEAEVQRRQEVKQEVNLVEILKDPVNDDIPFTWQGKVSKSFGEDVIEEAFKYAAREELLKAEGSWIIQQFYISDSPGGLGRDSRSLDMKYPEGDPRRDLQPGQEYFLRQV